MTKGTRRVEMEASAAGKAEGHPDGQGKPPNARIPHIPPLPLYEVHELTKHYPARNRSSVRAVDGVSLAINRGETYGIVGESGCGKSTLARLLLLLETPTSGVIRFEGNVLTPESKGLTRAYRKAVQPVFQDPFSSLSPRLRVWRIVSEPLEQARPDLSKEERRAQAREALRSVGLTAEHGDVFPHELSGGQRQRVAIARALVAKPRCIVLDEPVSSLDVSVRSQIVNLLRELQREFGMTYIFIAHDLAVVRYLSDRVGVMYLGELVEEGPSEQVCQDPLHPYTQALLSNVLSTDPDEPHDEIILEGELPSPSEPPSGCRFHTRCPVVMEKCATTAPPLVAYSKNRRVACHLHPAP